MADEYLEHYGRLGMKWGQHIFGREKTFNYSVKKLSKLDNKSKRKGMKSEYQKSKADNYQGKNEQLKDKFFFKFGAIDRFREKRLARKAHKYYRKSKRNLRSSQRAYKRAQRLVTAINKEFGDYQVSQLSAEDIALGREYVIQAFENYQRS